MRSWRSKTRPPLVASRAAPTSCKRTEWDSKAPGLFLWASLAAQPGRAEGFLFWCELRASGFDRYELKRLRRGKSSGGLHLYAAPAKGERDLLAGLVRRERRAEIVLCGDGGAGDREQFVVKI